MKKCIISDYLSHNAVAVYVFIAKVLQFLKATVPEIRYIHYFSDGSAAQYKNFKNFANLCSHLKDHGITADWSFFATSHGKSPCDGIGGTLKRLAQRKSLQHPVHGHILTAQDLFEFSKQLKGIKTFFVSSSEVEAAVPLQEERFAKAHTVAGTRENHYFEPIDESRIRVSRVANDSVSFTANVLTQEHVNVRCQDLQPGQYVACIYDKKWWIGNVCEVSLEQQDAYINFMHPHGPGQNFHWPQQRDKCWVPELHIICIVPAPTASSLGRNYSLPEKTVSEIQANFIKMQY